MPDILVRGLDKRVVARLKRLAKNQGRSLQSEVKTILEREANAPRVDRSEFLKFLAGWREKMKDRKFPDSVALIREDRDR